MDNKDNYTITIEVRDKEGNLIADQNGNNRVSMHFDVNEVTDTQVKSILKSSFQTDTFLLMFTNKHISWGVRSTKAYQPMHEEKFLAHHLDPDPSLAQ